MCSVQAGLSHMSTYRLKWARIYREQVKKLSHFWQGKPIDMRFRFMTNGDTEILVSFYAVLSRIWSWLHNRSRHFKIESKCSRFFLWYLGDHGDYLEGNGLILWSLGYMIWFLLFKYAYCIITWSITHDSLKKMQYARGRFSFVMCTVSSTPRRSLELLC